MDHWESGAFVLSLFLHSQSYVHRPGHTWGQNPFYSCVPNTSSFLYFSSLQALLGPLNSSIVFRGFSIFLEDTSVSPSEVMEREKAVTAFSESWNPAAAVCPTVQILPSECPGWSGLKLSWGLCIEQYTWDEILVSYYSKQGCLYPSMLCCSSRERSMGDSKRFWANMSHVWLSMSPMWLTTASKL